MQRHGNFSQGEHGHAGLPTASIGDTVCTENTRLPLPTITVEEPTVSMSFLINTSPFAGREGTYVTTRNIRDRLARELERNLALKVCAWT
jgi:GTP-binding protein